MKKYLVIVSLITVLYSPAFAKSKPGLLKDSANPTTAKDTTIAAISYAGSAADSMAATWQRNTRPKVVSLYTPKIIPPNKFNAMIADNLNKYVVSYINSYAVTFSQHLQYIQAKSDPYFNIIEQVFHQFGIPEQLKYLAVIESDLNKNAVSRVGAVGPWQFMSGTARFLGLAVNGKHDERRNIYKSTEAAAKYLSQLHDMFHDWLLVIAAYNCGPGTVLRLLRSTGGSSFWDIKKYLPHESQRHVMKFLATTYILDRFSSFFGIGDDQANSMPYSGVANNAGINTTTIHISGRYCMPVIAKYLGVDMNQLNELNPDFTKTIATSGYDLKVPADKADLFKTNKNTILNESVQLIMENNRFTQSAEKTPVNAPEPIAKKISNQTTNNKKG